MRATGLILGFVALWFVLNRWILPWCGIPTCMSGECGPTRCSSCGPGPWDYGDKDVTQLKGDQP
jgi:hypothetical protein